MTDPDPLREYMRIVRALNLQKLLLFSVEAKLRKAGRPARKEILETRQKEILFEMDALRAEGEDWLAKLRRKPTG